MKTRTTNTSAEREELFARVCELTGASAEDSYLPESALFMNFAFYSKAKRDMVAQAFGDKFNVEERDYDEEKDQPELPRFYAYCRVR